MAELPSISSVDLSGWSFCWTILKGDPNPSSFFSPSLLLQAVLVQSDYSRMIDQAVKLYSKVTHWIWSSLKKTKKQQHKKDLSASEATMLEIRSVEMLA